MFKFSDKRLIFPYILALLGTIIMVVSVFLPYTTGTEEYKKAIDATRERIEYEELGYTNKDLKNLSMVDFARIYSTYSQDIFGNKDGYAQMVIVILIGGFAFLSAVFTLFKKAIPSIVFTILSFLIFLFQNFDFSFRGVVPSITYEWGTGYYIFYAAAILAFIGGVWLLVTKILIKKENTAK